MEEWPLLPAVKTRSGTSGCLLLRQLGGDLGQGVEARVGERLDLAQQDRGLRQADLGDARGLAAAGEGALLGLGLRGDDVCSACFRERWSSASAVTTICSACLRARARSASACLRARARSASPWFSAICTWTFELVSSVCICRLRLGLVERLQLLGGGALLLVGLDLLDRELPSRSCSSSVSILPPASAVSGLPIRTSTHSMSNSWNRRRSSVARLVLDRRRAPEQLRASSSCGRRRGSRR